MRRAFTLLFATLLSVSACGDDASTGLPSEEGVTTTAAPSTSIATTTTVDPDALIVGVAAMAPGVYSVVGSGEVRFESGPEPEVIRATLDRTVPVENGTSGDSFCLLCVAEIHIAPMMEVPVDLFAVRTGSESNGLDWKLGANGTIRQHLKIVRDPATGINVVASPRVVESLTVDAVVDIPRVSVASGYTIVTGPEGCVLSLTSSGFVLDGGSARLVGG